MKRGFKKPLKPAEIRKQKLIKEYERQALKHLEQIELVEDLEQNLEVIGEILGDSGDVIIRQFKIGGQPDYRAALIFIDGLVDNSVVDEYILAALMYQVEHKLAGHEHTADYIFTWLKDSALHINEVGETNQLSNLIDAILAGDCGLLVDNVAHSYMLNTRGWEKRGVQEPVTEAVVRGPREGFTENLRTNTALVRRRLKDPHLRVKQLKVGERTNTDVNLMYIKGLANEEIVNEIERRIKNIDFDGILESGYIEQFIQDSSWSPFPQIQNTERPDKVTANLLEGRIAIFVDGTPLVLIAPAIFAQFYQSPEDYYERFIAGSLIRLLRVLSLFIAIFLPSLYIAFSSFHPEMIPSRLAIAMAAGRSTVPFLSIVEAILMEVSIEILREASIRLPGLIGPTIGIVGALVIGEAAVSAGIVSPIMVIIVALTTIGSFATPSYSAAISFRMLRFPLMIAAAMFGLYGIMLVTIMIIIHLCSLKSFGVPYMAPFSPGRLRDIKDTFIRAPLYNMKTRPSPFKVGERKRVGEELIDQEEDKRE